MEEPGRQTFGKHGCLQHSDCNRRCICAAPSMGQTHGQTGYRKGMFLYIYIYVLYYSFVCAQLTLRPHSMNLTLVRCMFPVNVSIRQHTTAHIANGLYGRRLCNYARCCIVSHTSQRFVHFKVGYVVITATQYGPTIMFSPWQRQNAHINCVVCFSGGWHRWLATRHLTNTATSCQSSQDYE